MRYIHYKTGNLRGGNYSSSSIWPIPGMGFFLFLLLVFLFPRVFLTLFSFIFIGIALLVLYVWWKFYQLKRAVDTSMKFEYEQQQEMFDRKGDPFRSNQKSRSVKIDGDTIEVMDAEE